MESYCNRMLMATIMDFARKRVERLRLRQLIAEINACGDLLMGAKLRELNKAELERIRAALQEGIERCKDLPESVEILKGGLIALDIVESKQNKD